MKTPFRGRRWRPIRAIVIACALVVTPWMVEAQWVRGGEQHYLPASHNWVFRRTHVAADRLFNAFDYGHAILYETLYLHPQNAGELLDREFEFLTRRLLPRPPRLPLEEGAVEIAYARLVPEAKQMFEWAHVFHRQVYDILADERLTPADRDVEMAELLDYYLSRTDLAFSTVPKGMEIMDGQFYSLAFRRLHPEFNGLIWAYHWLQVGLYEPLLVYQGPAGQAAGVNETVARFWRMISDPPNTMPTVMPMTAGIAPTFAARYTQAAIIFDNLHMMHDVISDILASDRVPRERKRAEILRAAAMFRDDTSYTIPLDEWAAMGESMALERMGGRAVPSSDPTGEPAPTTEPHQHTPTPSSVSEPTTPDGHRHDAEIEEAVP